MVNQTAQYLVNEVADARSELALLTSGEMGRADALAVAAGVPSLTLMENAGRAVAAAAGAMTTPGARVAILCGPGNNGGDGFVAARYLREAGFDVQLSLLGPPDALKGDAAAMAQRWGPAIAPLHPQSIDGADLIIDALFGAGLARPITGAAADVITAVNASGVPVLAVDVPSGLDGTTGAALGPVVQALRTVTFFRRKPGHLLMPGRALCGEVTVADIGIRIRRARRHRRQHVEQRAGAVARALSLAQARRPQIQRAGMPSWCPDRRHTRARRDLGARGALRIGAGLVTVASPPDAVAINAAHLTAIMLLPFDGAQGLADILADTRKNAVLLGPGARASARRRSNSCTPSLASGAATVLDADAITSFAGAPSELFVAIAGRDPVARWC